ncbi:homocysteine S-methyltransferase family protein [Roseibacterium sp. SDUM158017]|uniref:homocysteine S-methyltransferase family protein n=1 Tax=Roseicyclus salinarum TaxID=3036773 RepID=UPI0024153A0A|nr:homocysteine S-methyltransferase family protein [Roseibacterium sp. SDUM158017]MDG4648196.1 homocysteine S-methyltransferase family protein [Roseibacterium sp. SDUM158017]
MNITILDGGMGQELVRRAGRATPLWAMQALLDQPGLVAEVHRDFFAAGAEVATANTYAVLPDRLETFGLSDRLEELIGAACAIAARARDEAGGGIVAGSLGPLGFSYQPQNAPPADEAAEVYDRVARLQARTVDVLLLETMSSVDQACGALMGAAGAGKPVWLALSVDDADGTRLRSGEALDAVVPLLRAFGPERVLLNCSRPEAVSQGLPILAGLHPHVGAYANGFAAIDPRFDRIGATTDLLSARKDITPAVYAEFALAWVAAGARTVGGCCEVGPAHIAELARHVAERDVPAG